MLRLILLFLIFPLVSNAQQDLSSEKELTLKLVNYRTQILSSDTAAVHELLKLENKHDAASWEDDYGDLLGAVLYLHMLDYDAEGIIRKFKKDKPADIPDCIFDAQEIEIITRNAELIDMINEGLVATLYPYALDAVHDRVKEYLFYEIDTNQHIAELGAGHGTYSILLGILNSEINITINELGSSRTKSIARKVEKNGQFINATQFEVVRGTKKSTNLEDDQFDRIIIRNAFHHFSHKEKMLSSIKNALKADGKLCLYEPTKEQWNLDHDYGCHATLLRQTIITEIESQGLILEAEDEVDGVLLLRFRMK